MGVELEFFVFGGWGAWLVVFLRLPDGVDFAHRTLRDGAGLLGVSGVGMLLICRGLGMGGGVRYDMRDAL